MQNATISKPPIATLHNDQRTRNITPTLPLPQRHVNQVNKLLKSPCPQTTHNPIESMHRRQHRHNVSEKQINPIPRVPENSHQKQQPKLQRHEQQAPNTSLLQLQNHKSIARVHGASHHSPRPLIIKMMKRQTKQTQDFTTVVLQPTLTSSLFITRRARAYRRERRIRSIHRIRNERQIRRARGVHNPSVEVGIQIAQEEGHGRQACFRALGVEVRFDVRRGAAGAGAEIYDFPVGVLVVLDFVAFDGAEDFIDQIGCQFCWFATLQERDASRPVRGQGVLRALLEGEGDAGRDLQSVLYLL